MVSLVIKNWDNKTWLSSRNYINFFNNFLLKQTRLDKNSKILDIGCGRGKIIGRLSSKIKLENKPIGLDVINHKDKDRRIKFFKNDAIKYLKKTNKKFDLILIKQTIHLFNLNDIKKLLDLSYSCLNYNGKILIFSLEPKKNEIPTFSLMKKRLNASMTRDIKILKIVSKKFPNLSVNHFKFKVKISKNEYIEMIKNRFISILLNMPTSEILKGIIQIKKKFKDKIIFKDKLICLKIKKETN